MSFDGLNQAVSALWSACFIELDLWEVHWETFCYWIYWLPYGNIHFMLCPFKISFYVSVSEILRNEAQETGFFEHFLKCFWNNHVYHFHGGMIC